MDNDQLEKPLLMPTSRGFSVLYRNKYLYSKYNPAQAMTLLAETLQVGDSTLIICCSPVLPYGLQVILEKLPVSSYMLAVEYDQLLMRLSLDNGERSVFTHPQFSYIRTDVVSEVVHKIESLPLFPFKKCLCVSCSGGVQLYQAFYDEVNAYAEEVISRFWQNRITLMHLGRNYVHNTFQNLIALCDSVAHTNEQTCCGDRSNLQVHSEHCRAERGNRLFGSGQPRLVLTGRERICKPIMVVGAGPSLDHSRNFLHQYRSSLFILAVDAAAAALLPDIVPDAVVLVESQYWIDSAFIGLRFSVSASPHDSLRTIPLFADITASPRALRAAGGPVFHFCTDYAQLHYLTRLYSVLQPLILQPMGSVGLTAIQLALRLTEADMPVFHTGLDFSWQSGLTHARGASPVKKLFAETTRTQALYKLNIPPDVRFITGKRGLSYRTTALLSGYAELYRHVFAQNRRIFDIGQQGCRLSDRSPELTESEAARLLTAYTAKYQAREKMSTMGQKAAAPCPYMNSGYSDSTALYTRSRELYTQLKQYLAEEYEVLTMLTRHLQGGYCISEQELLGMLTERDYLYSHFPDAARGYTHNLGFLKRVSIELRSILKLLDIFQKVKLEC